MADINHMEESSQQWQGSAWYQQRTSTQHVQQVHQPRCEGPACLQLPEPTQPRAVMKHYQKCITHPQIAYSCLPAHMKQKQNTYCHPEIPLQQHTNTCQQQHRPCQQEVNIAYHQEYPCHQKPCPSQQQPPRQQPNICHQDDAPSPYINFEKIWRATSSDYGLYKDMSSRERRQVFSVARSEQVRQPFCYLARWCRPNSRVEDGGRILPCPHPCAVPAHAAVDLCGHVPGCPRAAPGQSLKCPIQCTAFRQRDTCGQDSCTTKPDTVKPAIVPGGRYSRSELSPCW